MPRIATLVGSLRQHSINMTLAKGLEKLAGPRFSFSYPDIGALPHYNDDLWSETPQSVSLFKREIEASDAVLFVTPELNRSIPSLLKNAIEWGSRPWGDNSWAGKPASVIGASPGAIGTAVAQSHLRSILPVLELSALGQPEVYLQMRPGLFDEDLNVTDDQTRSFLEAYIESFEDWIGAAGRNGRAQR